MKMQELCERINVAPRQLKYLLEQGMIPPGVDPSPSTGHHRQLTLGQAFWLAVVLKLKQAGVAAPLASDITNYVKRHLRGITRNLNWDFQFSPFDGDLTSSFWWCVEIGDNEFIHLLTDGNPSRKGVVYEFPWYRIGGNKEVLDPRPAACVRIDLTRIAEMLR